nr:hypothetical protein [Tanacetum cinerariifolium]
MTTLAEHMIVARAENRPMLEKSMYDLWASRIRLFIKGKKHGTMMLDSIDNGPLVYPTVEENGQTRPKKYFELTEDRVKMLMKGTKLSYQERECRLYNLFDKFAHVPSETLYEYYWRFSQLINDMHTIGMTMQQVQINTKFLNALPSEWSKFVTEVKLDKSFYTTKYSDSLDFIANSPTLYNPSQSPQHSAGPLRVVKCYNYQGEGHMVRHCTQAKRPRNAAWFKEKLMLAEAQEAAFQIDDLDAYESDCDDLSSAKAFLMANLSSCDHKVLFEVPYFESYLNDMINQDVQEMQYFEQTHVDDFEDNEIHSGSNIISYSRYLKESQDAVLQDTNSSAPNDLLVLSLVEQMTDHVAHLDKENQINKMVNESLTIELERYKDRITILEQRLNQEIDTLKETLSNNVKERESLSKTINVFKTESKEKECNVIAKEHVMVFVIDDEETLILEEESRSKTLVKHAFDKTLLDENTKVQPVFNQMEDAFDQCSVDKNVFEIQIKQLRIDNDKLLNQIMSQEIMHIVANSVDILDVKKSCAKNCNNIENELRKLKGKNVVNTMVSKPNANLALGIFKLDIEPISLRLKNNKDAHKELLVHASQTCSNSSKPRVKPTTSASESKPSGNTKNNKITNALVKHSIRNVRFKSSCAICNKCLFDANHDMCLVDYVNVRLKSKSKRNKKRKGWKPTSKVFTDVGYKQKPSGRFFTIDGNSCPLTRITPKKILHLKETTPKSVETPKPEIKVYSRRPKQIKSAGLSKKAKILKSKIANNSEPTHLWGSNATYVLSSSSIVDDRLSKLFSGIWTLDVQNI